MIKKVIKLMLCGLLMFCCNSIKAQNIQHRIYFYVNTDSILSNENVVNDTIFKYIDENVDRIESMEVIGSASPEGLENDYLSNIRATKVANMLPKVDNILSIGENYSVLKELIEKSDEEYKYDVLNILNNSKRIKDDLKKLQNGKVWKDLLEKYFPKLRYAEIRGCFKNDTIVTILPFYEIDTIYITNKCQEFEKKPIFALKTNLILDAVLAVNIQAEYYSWIWGLSGEFEYTFPWYQNDKKHRYYQLLNGTVGIRKYLNNEYTKWYVGIYGNTGYYDFCFKDDNGFQGEHHGFGISLGYVFRHNKFKRIKFEPYARIGYLSTEYDKYYTSVPYNGKYYYTVDDLKTFKPRDRHAKYFGVTMIGFNFTFDLVNIWYKKK